MASPIQSGGFNVGVMPGVNYLDPRLLAPAWGDIVPAASRGAAFGNQIIQINDEAQMRPIRQQLAQIQLQEAQNRLSMAPIEQQLAALRLGEAQQRAAIPEFITENVDVVGGGTRLAPVDASAPFADFQITEEFSPRERVTRGQRVAAGGLTTPFERRETLASPAELRRQAAQDALAARAQDRLAAGQQSLIDYRASQAETAALRAENDRIKADAAMLRAQQMENNPSFGFVDVKGADGRTRRQYFNKADPTKIVHEVDRGVMSDSIFAPGATFNMGGTSGGGGLANLAAQYGAKKPAAPAGTVATLTVEEARTAPIGTIFLGTDGKKRQKNANGTVSIIVE